MAGPQRVTRDPKRKRFLIYGDPGSGKTHLIGTSPKPLIIHPPTDHVEPSMRGASSVGADEPMHWEVNTWEDMTEVGEYLRLNPTEFEWVWVDSISLLQDHLLDDVWQATLERKPSRGEFGRDKQEYGINMQRLEEWIRLLTSLPFNVGITAHPFRTWDEEDEPLVLPWVQGKNMPQKICGYMTLVGFLMEREHEKHGSYRLLQTKKLSGRYAKDQYNAFDGRVVRPSIPEMEETIKQALAKENAAKRSSKTATRRRTTRRK